MRRAAPPPPPPPISNSPLAPTASIVATPNVITAGGGVVLTWRTTEATDVSIDGLGPVPTSGTRTVTPIESTNYHLVAKGTGGTVDATARVTVEPPSEIKVPIAPTKPNFPLWIRFSRNSTDLSDQNKLFLDELISHLGENKTASWRLNIIGATIEGETSGLAEMRAEVIKSYLVSRGVDGSHIAMYRRNEAADATSVELSKDSSPPKDGQRVWVEPEIHTKPAETAVARQSCGGFLMVTYPQTIDLTSLIRPFSTFHLVIGRDQPAYIQRSQQLGLCSAADECEDLLSKVCSQHSLDRGVGNIHVKIWSIDTLPPFVKVTLKGVDALERLDGSGDPKDLRTGIGEWVWRGKAQDEDGTLTLWAGGAQSANSLIYADLLSPATKQISLNITKGIQSKGRVTLTLVDEVIALPLVDKVLLGLAAALGSAILGWIGLIITKSRKAEATSADEQRKPNVIVVAQVNQPDNDMNQNSLPTEPPPRRSRHRRR